MAQDRISVLDFVGEYNEGKYSLNFDPMFELRSDRIQLINSMPFFGHMIMGLEPIIVEPENPYIQTAATDGQRIYYNPVFMHLLPQKKRLFVHAHELMHNVIDTLGRKGERDHQLWNAASDYVINAILKENGFELPSSDDLQNGIRALEHEFGVTPEKIAAYFAEHEIPAEDAGKVFCLYHEDFKGMSAEEVYEKLVEQEDEIDKKLKKQGKGDPDDNDDKGQQGGSGGDADGDEDSDQNGNGGSSSKQGKDKQGKKNKPGSGSEREKMRKYKIGSLDQHPMQDMSKEALDKVRQGIRARLNEARAMHAGKTPVGMDRMFDQINNPKIRWQDRLSAEIMDFKDADYTWDSPNSYYFGQGMTLPSLKYENTIRIRFICDASGSIGAEDQMKCMGEMMGIARQFDSFNIEATSFDTVMYAVETYTEENCHDIKKFPFKGGGGTSFKEPFDWLMKDPDEYDAVIFFTDGYGDGWYENCAPKLQEKMFWLITENYGTPPQPTWGKTIYYDKHEGTS